MNPRHQSSPSSGVASSSGTPYQILVDQSAGASSSQTRLPHSSASSSVAAPASPSVISTMSSSSPRRSVELLNRAQWQDRGSAQKQLSTQSQREDTSIPLDVLPHQRRRRYGSFDENENKTKMKQMRKHHEDDGDDDEYDVSTRSMHANDRKAEAPPPSTSPHRTRTDTDSLHATPPPPPIFSSASFVQSTTPPRIVPSASPSLPLELQPYTYQRTRAHDSSGLSSPDPLHLRMTTASPSHLDSSYSGTMKHIPLAQTQQHHHHDFSADGDYDDDEEEEEEDDAPKSKRAPSPVAPVDSNKLDDITLVSPADLLAPPLSPLQMESLYRMTVNDYMRHLTDCLRIRVLAFLLFLCTVFTIAYFSRGQWLVVCGCIYLMACSLVAIRGSLRGERTWVNYYYSALIVWIALYILTFTVWLITDGIEPGVESRCQYPPFAALYGTNCSTSGDCIIRCKWEMRINLMIEYLTLATIVAAGIAFLAWDASRLSTAMFLWSYHPLRTRWHADLMLFNRYAEVAQPQQHENEISEFAASLSDANDQATKSSGLPSTTKKTHEGASTTQQQAHQTYGSGIVGETDPTTSTSIARRRGGPLRQLYREEMQLYKEAKEQRKKTAELNLPKQESP